MYDPLLPMKALDSELSIRATYHLEMFMYFLIWFPGFSFVWILSVSMSLNTHFDPQYSFTYVCSGLSYSQARFIRPRS